MNLYHNKEITKHYGFKTNLNSIKIALIFKI